ncbi:MAG: hypothetical protein ACI4MK_09070 [Aristaeellaceae bacterium]
MDRRGCGEAVGQSGKVKRIPCGRKMKNGFTKNIERKMKSVIAIFGRKIAGSSCIMNYQHSRRRRNGYGRDGKSTHAREAFD